MMVPGIAGMVLAYLIGGVPIGYLVARSRGLDIRTVGSGNIGATNVQRVLGTKLGLVVWVADVAKAYVPVAGASAIWPLMDGRWWLGAIGLSAVVGHCWSPYLGLKGGRGVSTILGFALALNPAAAGVGLALWIGLVAVTRYISLASIVAGLTAGPLLLACGSVHQYWVSVLVAGLLVTWRHTPNIRRLLAGTESKIGQRREAPHG